MVGNGKQLMQVAFLVGRGKTVYLASKLLPPQPRLPGELAQTPCKVLLISAKVLHMAKAFSASRILAPLRFCTWSRMARLWRKRPRSTTYAGEGVSSNIFGMSMLVIYAMALVLAVTAVTRGRLLLAMR